MTSFGLRDAHDAISDRQRATKVITAKTDDDQPDYAFIHQIKKASLENSGLPYKYAPATIINGLEEPEPQIYHSIHLCKSDPHSSETPFNILYHFPNLNSFHVDPRIRRDNGCRPWQGVVRAAVRGSILYSFWEMVLPSNVKRPVHIPTQEPPYSLCKFTNSFDEDCFDRQQMTPQEYGKRKSDSDGELGEQPETKLRIPLGNQDTIELTHLSPRWDMVRQTSNEPILLNTVELTHDSPGWDREIPQTPKQYLTHLSPRHDIVIIHTPKILNKLSSTCDIRVTQAPVPKKKFTRFSFSTRIAEVNSNEEISPGVPPVQCNGRRLMLDDED